MDLVAEADASSTGLLCLHNVRLRDGEATGQLHLEDLSISGPFGSRQLPVKEVGHLLVESGIPASFKTDVNSLPSCENGCAWTPEQLQLKLVDAANNEVRSHLADFRLAALEESALHHSIAEL